jgi:membrane protease YdiL (CAAX protease family)
MPGRALALPGTSQSLGSESLLGLNPYALPPAQPMHLRDIALFLVGGFIVGTVLGVIALAVARTHSRFAEEMIASSAIYGSWAVSYRWLAQKRGWDTLQSRFSRTAPKALLIAAACGVGVTVLTSAAEGLLRWFGIDVAPPPTLAILPRNAGQLIVALVLLAIIAPLAEELIFRGLLLDWLKGKINVWAAALILSVPFALLHNNGFKLGAVGALAFGVRMTLGLVSSVFAIRYRTLRPSFVLHATVNSIACVLSVWNSP